MVAKACESNDTLENHITYFGTNGATLMSATLNPSNPNTLKLESTHASSGVLPILTVQLMCHELPKCLRTCSQTTSSAASGSGPITSIVFFAYTGARSSRVVCRMPSMSTLRSKGCVQNRGCMIGASFGSVDFKVTVPWLCALSRMQIAPTKETSGEGS